MNAKATFGTIAVPAVVLLDIKFGLCCYLSVSFVCISFGECFTSEFQIKNFELIKVQPQKRIYRPRFWCMFPVLFSWL